MPLHLPSEYSELYLFRFPKPAKRPNISPACRITTQQSSPLLSGLHIIPFEPIITQTEIIVSVLPILVNIYVIILHGTDQHHKKYCECVKTLSVD